MESEQTEHGKRQKNRSIIQVNEGVQRHIHPAEEQLIEYPSIPQSQQMELNRISASNSRKNEKSHSLLDQRTQPQLFQQRSNYSQQLPLQDLLHASRMPQEQFTSEEFDPYRTVRKLHMRQREFMTQPQLATTSFPEIGQQQGHLVNYSAFVQETPKPQRERKEKRRTIQSNARNTLAEPLEEISYIPRDPQSVRGQQFTEGNVNELDLTSYMQLPSVEQDSKICGKCGEQGHMKRQCTANVACDFCKTRSHSTLACRTYANFVKEHALMSSRKNTPEKFHNELDVNLEVAKRVELELSKWQREHEPKGKPPLPQPRKQQIMNSQQYLTQEPPYSQDIRVQMGEQVHTELHQPQQQRYHPAKKVNNRFIAEDRRYFERGPQEQAGGNPIMFDPQGYNPVIKVNNHFITEDRRYWKGRSQEQTEREPAVFDLQQFQPTIKGNNCFITEKGRNYERSPVYVGDGTVVPGQQNFQPAINANNHFIEENSEQCGRRTTQQYDHSTITDVPVPNNKRINRNIAENYAMRGPQRETSHTRGPQNEVASTYVESNVHETENTVRRHSQQVQRNLNEHSQAINSENSTNQEYLERNHIQQDAANVNTNAGTNPEACWGEIQRITYYTKKPDRVGADRPQSKVVARGLRQAKI